MSLRVLTACALAVALWLTSPAAAWADVGQAAQRVQVLEQQARSQAEKTRALEVAYRTKTAEIAKLKGLGRSWNRDRRLKEHLTSAQTMAQELDKATRAQRETQLALTYARHTLIASLDSELPRATPARQAELLALRGRTQAALPKTARKVRIAQVQVDPLDDPEDLEDKAALVTESETQLEKEAARMEARARFYRRLARLERNRRRASEADVFAESSPRRRTVRTEDSRTSTAESNDDNVAGDPTAPQAGADGEGAFGGPPVAGSSGPPTTDQSAPPESDAELTVVYADVVEPGTLDALRRADRGGPDDKAQAAENARDDLRARAARLKELRKKMLDRAQQLRKSGP